MNVKPDAITVLCYGDSNTYGQKPDKSGRYTAGERWTGVMQKQLGDDYYVIEEGLSSRTTDLEYAGKSGRNGRVYFEPCLQSHDPLHIVLVMLGTNDVKTEFNRSAYQIAEALEGYVGDVREHALAANESGIRIVLVSPAPIDSSAASFAEYYAGKYDDISAQKTAALSAEIQKVAAKLDVEFFDAAKVAQVGKDGIHLSAEAHMHLGAALAGVVKGGI